MTSDVSDYAAGVILDGEREGVVSWGERNG